MPEVNPKTYHLSASSIASFKSCPTKFRLAYREGLRPAEDTESQRVGTNWHKLHEVYAKAIAETASEQESLVAVITELNHHYADVPASKTAEEWALEREILLQSFIGYLWRWQDDPVEVLASEVPFELPLKESRTGMYMPVSEVVRVGKIDHIIRWQGSVCCLERKSTSRSIDIASDYWDKGKKDTQVSMYALALQDLLQREGESWFRMTCNDSEADGGRFGNTLYDVWHKPTIKLKVLTQGETAEFIKTGDYQGKHFDVKPDPIFWRGDPKIQVIQVGEQFATIEQGKKAIAIRETVEMYGARLLADIMERPDFYFARREIARTDQELRAFEETLYAVYQAQKMMERNDCWFENEQQCRATYPCPYIGICYTCGSKTACDGKTVPIGYKRIFADVNLTINGHDVE